MHQAELRAPHALAALALIAARIAALIAALALALVPAPAAHAAAAAAFEDTLAQRLLACTGCHGKDGRAASDGYHPRIAGKPAGYLLRQLRAFRDGQRRYGLMGQLLAPLDDRYLREIAAHFAALDLPYAAPAPSRADAATLAEARDLLGEEHVWVLGEHEVDLAAMKARLVAEGWTWRTGARHADAPDCMAQIAQRLAANDVAALAHWLAAQPVPAAPRPASAPGPLPLRCGSAGAAP